MEESASPYLFAALGGVAVWLLLPIGGQDRGHIWPAGLGLTSLLGLVVLSVQPPLGMNGHDILLGLFGSASLASTVLMITQERPVYAALWFVMVILSVAGLLLMMGAQFLAAVLVVVYAGAILVTYLFVIMLAVKAGMPEYDTRTFRPGLACCTGVLVAVMVLTALGQKGYPYVPPSPSGIEAAGAVPVSGRAAAESPAWRVHREYVERHTASLGRRLFAHHFVALQAAGVLLVVALAGAIAIAQRPATLEPATISE